MTTIKNELVSRIEVPESNSNLRIALIRTPHLHMAIKELKDSNVYSENGLNSVAICEVCMMSFIVDTDILKDTKPDWVKGKEYLIESILGSHSVFSNLNLLDLAESWEFVGMFRAINRIKVITDSVELKLN